MANTPTNIARANLTAPIPHLHSTAQIASIADPRAREAAYVAAADNAISNGNAMTLKDLASACADESTPVVVSRTVFKHIADRLQALPAERNDFVEEVANHAVERLRGRVASFEEVDYHLRYLLYRIHWGDEDYLRAATVLSQARIDSPGIGMDDGARAAAYVKVAQAFLKADDDLQADRFIKRAGDFVFKADTTWQIQMQYKACYAQILDAKRKFLEASLRYIELSQLPVDQVEEEELLAMLEKAVVCIVLGPAGPQRQRVMGTLHRDERIDRINPVVSSMLHRMYHERFVLPSDITSFEATLQPHQKAVTADGSTIFAKAIVDHNLMAAARVYSTITFDSLGQLLGIDAKRAERTAAKMITEHRLAATIDHIDSTLVFTAEGQQQQQAGSSAGASDAAAGGVDALLAWDSKIKDVCLSVNGLVERVAKQYPPVIALAEQRQQHHHHHHHHHQHQVGGAAGDGPIMQ